MLLGLAAATIDLGRSGCRLLQTGIGVDWRWHEREAEAAGAVGLKSSWSRPAMAIIALPVSVSGGGDSNTHQKSCWHNTRKQLFFFDTRKQVVAGVCFFMGMGYLAGECIPTVPARAGKFSATHLLSGDSQSQSGPL